MAFLQLTEGRLAFGGRLLFEGVSLRINSGDRLALAGANGSGKTTLMKALSGLLELDRGEVSLSRSGRESARVSYLPQSGMTHGEESVRTLALQAFTFLEQKEQRMQELAEEMAIADDKTAVRLAEEHHEIHERLLNDGYYDKERRTEEVLTGLGFSKEQLDRPASTFSGGWQMRIALARILLSDPEILLLDEPTNYLDLEAREWLLGFIRRFSGGVLIVSHDRYFLDQTINGVLELFQRKLRRFPGNYTGYEKLRQQENKQLAAAWAQQQEEIGRIEDFIRRFRYNASKAPQVQSRVKMLEKMEIIEPPPGLTKMKLRFPEPPHSGREVLRLEDFGKAYGSHEVIRNLSLTINKGEKLVVAGHNGAGKSTLLRCVAGVDAQYTGTLQPGTGVSVGYFSQDHELSLPPEMTILDYLEETAPTELIPRLRDMLGALLFHGEDVDKKLGVLSGGEKSRISLLKLLLEPHNLLILDEPTNHLDIHSKDVLCEALSHYSGTLIFVSHDRFFIEGLATRVLELSEAGARVFPGDYHYYLRKRDEEVSSEPPDSSAAGQQKETAAVGKISHEEEKKLRNKLRSKERECADLLEQHEKEQNLHEKWMREMTRPEIYSDPKEAARVQKEIEKSEAKLAELDEAWMTAEEEREALSATAPAQL